MDLGLERFCILRFLFVNENQLLSDFCEKQTLTDPDMLDLLFGGFIILSSSNYSSYSIFLRIISTTYSAECIAASFILLADVTNSLLSRFS